MGANPPLIGSAVTEWTSPSVRAISPGSGAGGMLAGRIAADATTAIRTAFGKCFAFRSNSLETLTGPTSRGPSPTGYDCHPTPQVDDTAHPGRFRIIVAEVRLGGTSCA